VEEPPTEFGLLAFLESLIFFTGQISSSESDSKRRGRFPRFLELPAADGWQMAAEWIKFNLSNDLLI